MTTENRALMEALEPCERCGGQAVMRRDDDPGYPWYVTFEHDPECVMYAVPTDLFRSFATEAEAIVAWNRRHRPTQSSGEAAIPGKFAMLKTLTDADIEREGEMASVMVRAGLLRDLIDYASRPAPLPAEREVDGEELSALRSALKNLLDACYQADGAENLPEEIDGSLLDAAAEALELQYPIIWTPEQVAILQERQADRTKHPYTCGGDRYDRAHQWHADEACEEPGLLYPTERGWKCPACDYRQFWSHETGGAAALAPAQPVSEQGEGEGSL